MGKAKRGPALFELLDDDGSRSGGVKVPSWWSRPSRPTDLQAVRAARVAVDSPPTIGGSLGSTGTRLTPRPLFEVEGDRICVSLTSVMTAVVVFLVLGTLLGAYRLGASRGDEAGFRRGFGAGQADAAGTAGDELEAVRNQPPASHLLGGLLVEGGSKTVTGAAAQEDRAAPKGTAVPSLTASVGSGPTSGWVRNLTYIVVQEFPAAGGEKAKHAREFLAQRGVNTELVPLNNDTSLLIATQGYNHKDPAQKRLAEQLLEKVRTIGAQYYGAGGGYRLEGYYKTLKRDHW